MQETQTAAAVLTGVSLITIFPNLDVSVLLAAFSGASVFALSKNDFKPIKKIIFLILAFINGIVAAKFTANVIQHFSPMNFEIPPAIGALLSAALSINILTFIINYDVKDLLGKLEKEKT